MMLLGVFGGVPIINNCDPLVGLNAPPPKAPPAWEDGMFNFRLYDSLMGVKAGIIAAADLAAEDDAGPVPTPSAGVSGAFVCAMKVSI